MAIGYSGKRLVFYEGSPSRGSLLTGRAGTFTNRLGGEDDKVCIFFEDGRGRHLFNSVSPRESATVPKPIQEERRGESAFLRGEGGGHDYQDTFFLRKV